MHVQKYFGIVNHNTRSELLHTVRVRPVWQWVSQEILAHQCSYHQCILASKYRKPNKPIETVVRRKVGQRICKEKYQCELKPVFTALTLLKCRKYSR